MDPPLFKFFAKLYRSHDCSVYLFIYLFLGYIYLVNQLIFIVEHLNVIDSQHIF